MIAKHMRLRTQDIQRLLRRGQKLSGKKFLFLTQRQLPHKPSQWGFQLPVKVDKRAVVRNMCKRVFYDLAWGGDTSGIPTRTFVCLHKDAFAEVIQLIATGDKTTILETRKQWCTQDLAYFYGRKWTVLSSIEKPSVTMHMRGWHNWSKGSTKAIKK